MTAVLWHDPLTGGLDRCNLAAAPDGVRLAGTALLAYEGLPYEVRYSVIADQAWRTLSVGVHIQAPDGDVRLALIADGEGRWTLGKEPLSQVDGALDVDLAVTPATNTLAIRRLGLVPGQQADLLVAYVRFPELSVEPLEQSYERLTEGRYRYANPGFAAELVTDEEGLVVDYEARWEAVARG